MAAGEVLPAGVPCHHGEGVRPVSSAQVDREQCPARLDGTAVEGALGHRPVFDGDRPLGLGVVARCGRRHQDRARRGGGVEVVAGDHLGAPVPGLVRDHDGDVVVALLAGEGCRVAAGAHLGDPVVDRAPCRGARFVGERPAGRDVVARRQGLAGERRRLGGRPVEVVRGHGHGADVADRVGGPDLQGVGAVRLPGEVGGERPGARPPGAVVHAALGGGIGVDGEGPGRGCRRRSTRSGPLVKVGRPGGVRSSTNVATAIAPRLPAGSIDRTAKVCEPSGWLDRSALKLAAQATQGPPSREHAARGARLHGERPLRGGDVRRTGRRRR